MNCEADTYSGQTDKDELVAQGSLSNPIIPYWSTQTGPWQTGEWKPSVQMAYVGNQVYVVFDSFVIIW